MENKSFWESGFGLTLRWIGYIPLGLIICYFVDFLCFMFLSWLFKSGKEFFVIGILLGGIAVIPACAYLFGGSVYLVSKICPKPKYGMIVFGTLFSFLTISGIVNGWSEMEWKLIIINTCAVLITAVVVYSIVEEEDKKLRQENEDFVRRSLT